jgi:hypothetical protein
MLFGLNTADNARIPYGPLSFDIPIRHASSAPTIITAHNEVLRQTQRDNHGANGGGGRGFLNVKNRSNEALGSPFNEQGGNAIAAGGVLPNTGSVAGNPNAPAVSSRKNSKSHLLILPVSEQEEPIMAVEDQPPPPLPLPLQLALVAVPHQQITKNE